MNNLISSTTEIIQLLTLNPASQVVMYLVIAICLLVAWFGLVKIATALKFPMCTGARCALTLLTLVALSLVAAAITDAFLAPRIANPALSKFLPLIVTCVMLLAAVVPISCFILKSHYLQTLSAICVPIIAAAIVSFLANAITGAIQQGGKGFSRTKDRTEKLDQVLAP